MLSNPHGSDGTQKCYMFWVSLTQLSNPHGSDGTIQATPSYLKIKTLSNPHGSDGTDLQFLQQLCKRYFLTHTVQMEQNPQQVFIRRNVDFLTHTVQMELRELVTEESITPQLSNPHGSDGTKTEGIFFRLYNSFLTHTVQMERESSVSPSYLIFPF